MSASVDDSTFVKEPDSPALISSSKVVNVGEAMSYLKLQPLTGSVKRYPAYNELVAYNPATMTGSALVSWDFAPANTYYGTHLSITDNGAVVVASTTYEGGSFYVNHGHTVEVTVTSHPLVYCTIDIIGGYTSNTTRISPNVVSFTAVATTLYHISGSSA